MAKLRSQLSFDLAGEPRYGHEDFLVSPSNEAAWTMIHSWPQWPDPTLLLVGPAGAGKSHLGAIWSQRSGAVVVAGQALGQIDIPELASANAILLEDVDKAHAIETPLFHLINLVRASKGFLLMTAGTFPDNWGLMTADLLSRLRLAHVVDIGSPDDALVRAVLVKLFADRQLAVEANLVEYLAVRIERSLNAARAVVAALDNEALTLARPITRHMAGEVIRRMQETE